MAPQIPLSFIDYVAARKGEAAARLREGTAYAYGGDLKVRSTVERLRPVTLALEAGVRFWHTVGKSRLLGDAVRVSEKQFPQMHEVLVRCADALQIPRPSLYVSPVVPGLEAHTFGASDEAVIVLGPQIPDYLKPDELTFVVGNECGHIQNNHTIYLTALYFLTKGPNILVKWASQPAVVALKGWARRAEITCDRAGLLCTRDLRPATAAMVKLALKSGKLFGDIDLDEYLKQMDEARHSPGRFDELFADHPNLPKRIKALRLFAETTYFKSVAGGPGGAEAPGITKEECDAQVAELLAVF